MIEGVKDVTIKNWNQPDLIYDIKEHNIYLKEILCMKLDDHVPVNIRNLFEVARNAMVYGYYYYPLYTLAAEQMHRVGESAVKEKILQIQIEKPSKINFNKSIKFLHEHGFMDDVSFSKWHSLRSLRNSSSHPEKYMLLPPRLIIEHVKSFAVELNKLFSE